MFLVLSNIVCSHFPQFLLMHEIHYTMSRDVAFILYDMTELWKLFLLSNGLIIPSMMHIICPVKWWLISIFYKNKLLISLSSLYYESSLLTCPMYNSHYHFPKKTSRKGLRWGEPPFLTIRIIISTIDVEATYPPTNLFGI